jgi:hypothetical protein
MRDTARTRPLLVTHPLPGALAWLVIVITLARLAGSISIVATMQLVLGDRGAWRPASPGSQPKTTSNHASFLVSRPLRRSTLDKVRLVLIRSTKLRGMFCFFCLYVFL